jgi:dolichol-phosphate mannosyltransferase
MVHLSVVIPVLNEESIVSELVGRVRKEILSLTNDYEIIIIDDGSKDKTLVNLKKICEMDSKIKTIKFSRNFGQHSAITAGIEIAQGQWIVIMDGDLQDRPEVIPELYAKASEGYDSVFVSRIKRNESIIYLVLQKGFYKILRFLSGIDFDGAQANFSIISKKVAEQFKRFPEKNRFYPSTIKWLGFNNGSISAVQGKRHSGKPSYNFKKRTKLGVDIITSSSNKPLIGTFLIGSLLILTSLIYAIYCIWNILK